jgi:uncharacterized protein (DUF1499 family)
MKNFVVLMLIFTLFSCTDRVPLVTGVDNTLEPCPDTPNCFLATYEFNSTDILSFMSIVSTIITEERTSDIISQDSHNLHATYTIPVFGWIDDLNIEVTPSPSGKMYLHIRSASREGNWDIGVNKRRVHRIVRKLSYEFNRKRL